VVVAPGNGGIGNSGNAMRAHPLARTARGALQAGSIKTAAAKHHGHQRASANSSS